jgi:hypothetical protein
VERDRSRKKSYRFALSFLEGGVKENEGLHAVVGEILNSLRWDAGPLYEGWSLRSMSSLVLFPLVPFFAVPGET